MTELDHCVLGIVWREGPLTAYAVRGMFSRSVTTAWSSSTGSIYPAIRRLVAQKLVRAGAPSDGRNTQELSITPAGIAALRAWLRTVPDGLAGLVADPLRTRVQFLAALPPAAVKRFLDEAERDARAVLRRLEKTEAEYALSHRGQEHWGMVGAVYEVRARLEWLAHLRRMHAAAPRAKARRVVTG